MSKKQIQVARNMADPVTIDAYTLGDFAWHKILTDSELPVKLWTVTHVPTGFTLGVAVDTAREAEVIVRRIIDVLDGREMATINGEQVTATDAGRAVAAMMRAEYRDELERHEFGSGREWEE